MKTKFRNSFAKDVKKIRDINLLTKIKLTIEEIENAENLEQVGNLKRLQASGRYYRIRIGSYRIGISFAENTVTFVRFLHRKEIYKFFP